jgi:hypothetical protein
MLWKKVVVASAFICVHRRLPFVFPGVLGGEAARTFPFPLAPRAAEG